VSDPKESCIDIFVPNPVKIQEDLEVALEELVFIIFGFPPTIEIDNPPIDCYGKAYCPINAYLSKVI
jgi:hypothetical protein